MTARLLTLLVGLLFATTALADQRIAIGPEGWVKVFDSPCVSAETIARIPEDQREGWSKAQGYVRGERFFGCWRSLRADVYILWEDGDQGLIPIEEFKPVPEV